MICTDIRISVSFKDHRKRKRLRTILGPGSTDYILDLWIATAMNHPSGILLGMDELDISLEAGWNGEPMVFIDALIKCGFLEKNEAGDYQLHDWVEHQEWVVKATERKEHAQKAAEARWNKSSSAQKNIAKLDSNAQGMPDACSENAHSMPEAMPQPTNQPINTNTVSSVPEEDGEAALYQNQEEAPEQPKEEKPTKNNYPEDFNTFFQAFPHKDGVSKKKAFEAWKKARDKPSLHVLLAMIEVLKRSDQWLRGIIPHPSTWLNGKCWETVGATLMQNQIVDQTPRPEIFDPATVFGEGFKLEY